MNNINKDDDFQFLPPEDINFDEFDNIDNLEFHIDENVNDIQKSDINEFEIPPLANKDADEFIDIPETISIPPLETNENNNSVEMMDNNFELSSFNIPEELPEEFNTNAEENVPANEPNIPDAQSLVANAVREKMAVMQNENDDFETEGFIDMTPPESDEMKTIENTPSNKKATSPISTKDDMYIKATERLKELSKIESEKMLNLIGNNNKTL